MHYDNWTKKKFYSYKNNTISLCFNNCKKGLINKLNSKNYYKII